MPSRPIRIKCNFVACVLIIPSLNSKNVTPFRSEKTMVSTFGSPYIFCSNTPAVSVIIESNVIVDVCYLQETCEIYGPIQWQS